MSRNGFKPNTLTNYTPPDWLLDTEALDKSIKNQTTNYNILRNNLVPPYDEVVIPKQITPDYNPKYTAKSYQNKVDELSKLPHHQGGKRKSRRGKRKSRHVKRKSCCGKSKKSRRFSWF